MTSIKIDSLNVDLEVTAEEADSVKGGEGEKSKPRVVFVGGWGSSQYQY